MPDAINQPLRVTHFVATKPGDAERGPMVILNAEEAGARLLVEGELAWVYGPRHHELATVVINPGLQKGEVVLRDVVGAAPSENVRVVKPDLDTRGLKGRFA